MSSRFKIKTEEQFQAALDRITALIAFKPGTPEFAEMTILMHAAKEYQDQLLLTGRRKTETVH